MTFNGFLRVLDAYRLGQGLPPEVAPSSFLFAFDQGCMVGRASIRHELVAPRGNMAGHIGYAVLPPFRNRGYGTQILLKSVRFARDQLGLDRVLVTCDVDNAASVRVIEKCGGVFENLLEDASLDATPRCPKRRYWIDTSTATET